MSIWIFSKPDSEFDYFRKSSDITLKELHKKGVGSTVKQAQVIFYVI
jgi:hypothetical protein